MKSELAVDVKINQMPTITSNLGQLKNQIGAFLENFNFVVTDDGVKFAKTKAQELNKLADTLDRLRIDKVKEVSAPIGAFETEAKEIYMMIKKTRQSLLDQILKCESETKNKIQSLLKQELDSLWKLHEVQKEFQKATFGDLAILSNITSTGRLAKKADDILIKRVLADRQMQDKISTRLMVLEGSSFKAGLKAPLGRHNVAHFLYADNYDEQLQSLIAVELSRQEETERRIAHQLEAEKQREIETINAQAQENLLLHKTKLAKEMDEAISLALPQEIIHHSQSKPRTHQSISKQGDTKYTLTVVMELEMGDMDVEKLKIATLKKFATAGFKSVKSVAVEKVAITQSQSSFKQEGVPMAEGSLF